MVFSGQGKGFDIDLITLISDAVSIPVIASSGAGAIEHFSDVFKKTNASAALAAGIFHRKEVKPHNLMQLIIHGSCTIYDLVPHLQIGLMIIFVKFHIFVGWLNFMQLNGMNSHFRLGFGIHLFC